MVGPVKVGVVGLGRGLMLTLPALVDNPAIVIAGAFDPQLDRAQQFSLEHSARAFRTYEELLADREIEAIYLATPHQLHAEQTIAAAVAGKHVLVEKPMATGIEECVRMVAACSASNVILIVGPSHGSDPAVRLAADLVSSNRFGPVRMVTSLNYTDFMYRPRRPEELDPAKGGGVVFSQAAHQIDIVRRIVGKPIASVSAVTGNWDPKRKSDGAYTALLTFADGVAATLTYSGYAHYDSDELVGWISELGHAKDPSRYGETRRNLATLTRDESSAKMERAYGPSNGHGAAAPRHHEHFGFIIVSCDHADLKILPGGVEIYGNDSVQFTQLAPSERPRLAVIDEFAAAIRGTREPRHDGQWGLETTAICSALMLSSQNKTPIDPNRLIAQTKERMLP